MEYCRGWKYTLRQTQKIWTQQKGNQAILLSGFTSPLHTGTDLVSDTKQNIDRRISADIQLIKVKFPRQITVQLTVYESGFSYYSFQIRTELQRSSRCHLCYHILKNVVKLIHRYLVIFGQLIQSLC